MNNSMIGLKKSPSAFIVVAVTCLLFGGSFVFGEQMVAETMWHDDPASVLTAVWGNLGGLYFGILLPILVASCTALLMAPEHQRGNIQWLQSQPHGTSHLLTEKIAVLALIGALIALLQVLVVALLGLWNGHNSLPHFGDLLLYGAMTGFGVFAVGSFYMWISTFTKATASTISAGLALTVTSMAVTVIQQVTSSSTSIETLLPTTQIISTAFVREAGATPMMHVMVKVLIALAWSGVFLLLTRQRLAGARTLSRSHRKSML